MRHVVLAFVLLALVAGAWLWLRGGGEDALPTPPATNVRADAEVSTAEPAKEAVAPAAESVVRAEAPVAPSDAEPFPADAQWIDVRIVDAATKHPVTRADVRWAGAHAWQKVAALPQRERTPFFSNQHRMARQFGWQTRSDGSGVARVTTEPHGITVFATEGSRYGMAHCPAKAPAEGHVLELREDVTLRVQVLDAHGEPAAGVAVRVRVAAPGKPDENGGSIQPVRTRSPDGIAEFEHVQDWRRHFGLQLDAGTEWRVALHVPGFDDAGVVFDRAAVPAEPIVLRLPPTGVVAARLLHEGRPWSSDVAFLAWTPPDDEHRQRNQATRAYRDENGWARLRVPLRVPLTVTCSVSYVSLERAIEGPTGEQQEVRVEFRTDEAICLVGRVLRADGTPLAGTALRTDYHLSSGASGMGAMVATDASGRFLWLMVAAPKKPTRLDSITWVYTPSEGPSQRGATGPCDLVAGLNDLGDVRLRAEPLVVSGRVRWDPPDQPSYAWVYVESLRPAGGRDGAERWDRVERLSSDQRPDGTFVMRGEVQPGRYRLAVSDANNLPVEPIEFRLGAEDVVVVVRPGSRLTANFLLPERLPRNTVSAVLVEPGVPQEKQTQEQLERFTADQWGPANVPNGLLWRALPAGTYTLELRGVFGVLRAIPDVVVPPPASGDPRLVDIDLRDALRAVLVRDTTQPPPEPGGARAHAFVEPREADEQWIGVMAGDDLVVPAPPRAFELLVAREGYRPLRLPVGATQTGVDVALEPWPTMAFTIADAPPLPDGVTWSLLLHDARPQNKTRYRVPFRGVGSIDDLMRPPRGPQPFANGIATVPIDDGTFSVHLYLQKEDGRSQSLREVSPKEVVGGPTVAPIPLLVSADEVRAAIAALQKHAAGK